MHRYQIRSRWAKMLSRCEDADHPQYHDYGGRGVSVCLDWHDFELFYLWCVSNMSDPEHQLDRIDNNSGYGPDNCRFVSREENARNKRSNKLLSAFGETKTMVEWSEDSRCRVRYATLMQRLLRGWGTEEALTSAPDSTRGGKVAFNAMPIEAWGEVKYISEWLVDDRCVYKNRKGVWSRISQYGWSPERAMTQPPGRGRPKKS